MGKWTTIIAFIGMLLCLITPYGANAQEAQYDLLYATLNDDNSYAIKFVNATSGLVTDVETLRDYGSDAGWSPDGRFIYLVNTTSSPTSMLTLVNVADNNRQIVTKELVPARCSLPMWWSPDGRFLVYLTLYNERSKVNLLDTTTGSVEPLPDPIGLSLELSLWSPYGRYFVYDRLIWDAQENHEAAKVNINGLADSVWSPQDDRFAYVDDDEVVILNLLDDSEQRYQASEILGWSADGRYLEVFHNGQTDLQQIRFIDTSQGQLLTLNGLYYTTLWSADDRYLAYENADHSMLVYDTLESSSTLLMNHETMQFAIPVWSPNGHWLAFSHESDAANQMRGLWISDLDAQESRQFALTLSNITYSHPLQWSPSGDYLMMSTEDGLTLFDRQKWALHSIDEAQGNLAAPRWSSDGRYLAFMKLNDGKWDIDVVDTQDYQTRNLTNSATQSDKILGWRGSSQHESLIQCGEG